MISTLQKLAGISSDIGHTSSSSINFNANLPVTIEVLKKIDAWRYRLKVGRKELTTKSQKELNVFQKYWANFSEAHGGILTISQMWQQPKLFDNDELFLPLDLTSIWEDGVGFSYNRFKAFLIEKLSDESVSKESFRSYGYMLLALSKYVIHLPLIQNNRKILLQFQQSDENTLLFYIASENLGPLSGSLTQNLIELHVMYEKSLYYLQKEQAKLGMITRFSTKKEIQPLFDQSDTMFDIKG